MLARRARWDPADLPEKKAKRVPQDLLGLRDLLDLLAQQARRVTLALLEQEEMQVWRPLHLRDRLCASSVEPMCSPVETMKSWYRSSVRVARATAVNALARSPVFAPESSCARTASPFPSLRKKRFGDYYESVIAGHCACREPVVGVMLLSSRIC